MQVRIPKTTKKLVRPFGMQVRIPNQRNKVVTFKRQKNWFYRSDFIPHPKSKDLHSEGSNNGI